MKNARHIPWAIRIVAYLFALGSIFSLLKFVADVLEWGEINFINLIAFFVQLEIARGILGFSRFWRFVALVWLGVEIVSILIYVLLVQVITPEMVTLEMFGLPSFSLAVPKLVVFIWLVLVGVVRCWEWWALGRPTVQKLFWQKISQTQLRDSSQSTDKLLLS